jgi:RNA polymerase sigma-70 factor (ECF subfamily)
MGVPPAFDLEGLLAEDQWIRRLARRLAGDAHAAEDLVQDTWAAALRAQGAAPRARALRPWLRQVLRNLWSDQRRAECARAARERRSARAEALEPESELVAELELRRRVAEALLQLEEPYRGALYLRFFRDQSLAAIAKRQGVALSSAHERIQHGLARLRARLDREHGGRRDAWALGLLRLARPTHVPIRALEVLAMAGGGLKLAATLLAVCGGLTWWWLRAGDGEGRASAGLVSAGPSADAAQLPEPAPLLPPAATRAPLDAEVVAVAASSPSALESELEAALVHGRVVDPYGVPLAAVSLGWRGSSEEGASTGASARSDSEGRFALPEGEGAVYCLEPELVTLVAGEPSSLLHARSTLVVAAARATFSGIVVDPAGAPVAGAQLRFGPRDELLRDLALPASSLARPEWRPRSDANGAFELTEACGGPRVVLQVEAVGFWVKNVELPATSTSALVIELSSSTHERRLHGLVLAPDGAALAGASVSAGDAIVTSSADGRFELALGGTSGAFGPAAGSTPLLAGDGLHLVALKRGLLPARVALANVALEAPIVLQLGARAASIAGTVREADGRPAPGIIVWPRDPTPFGREIVLAGEGMSMAWSKTVEDELAGGVGRRGAVSDAQGAFEVPGLLVRDYELLAFDPERAELFGPWPLAAGARGVELVLARTAHRGRVAGRVVSRQGTPLAGVELSAQSRTSGLGPYDQVPNLRPRVVTTDDEGRFEFQELALDDTALQLVHTELGLRTVDLARHGDLEHLELVEAVLCSLQVESGGDERPASFAVLDAEGATLELLELFDGGWSVVPESRLVRGLSAVVRAPESAVTVVLRRGEVEVARRSLELSPGELTRVRF